VPADETEDTQVAAFAALTAELAGQRFTATSDGGCVSAEVDGTGVLLRITVAPDALRGAHPERVGPDTVAAVAAARAAATAAAEPRIAEVFA
jgi:DNA-binding protein YbaB